jgi:hypothetical protein
MLKGHKATSKSKNRPVIQLNEDPYRSTGSDILRLSGSVIKQKIEFKKKNIARKP